MKYHTPVLIKEVIECLLLKPSSKVVDTTLGDGGHSLAILDRIGTDGQLIGIDTSSKSLNRARKRLGRFKNAILAEANFSEIQKVVEANNFGPVSGILFDLGIASWQVGESGIGLSFQHNEPLDMRFSPKLKKTASEIINHSTPKELMTIFEEYGDIRRAKQLVNRIIQVRQKSPIKTTQELVNSIRNKSPKILAPIFQALRIVVNQEFENLESALKQAVEILSPRGRLVVISYHSGEDRIVKHIFKDAEKINQVKILTSSPITPTQEEIRSNPRSRSAKMRALERI